MVKRYDPVSRGELTPVDDGPFVDYADYIALQAECERLRKELRNRDVPQGKPDGDGWIVADTNCPPCVRYDCLWNDGDTHWGCNVSDGCGMDWWEYLCRATDEFYITHWRPSKAAE